MATASALPAPPIAAPLGDVRTPRLDLRRFASTDLAELVDVFSHPEIWEFPYGRAFTPAETESFLDAQIAAWGEVGAGLWVARTLDDERIVGYVGLAVPTFLPEVLPAFEVGWRFIPGVWGRGYASEGATAALDEAFGTLGLDHVCSVPQDGNPRSARVAERLGMRFVREVVVEANERRGEVTGLLYDIDANEWSARRLTRQEA
jgi:RimJ/RimL family protein N-acetyltransferase